MDALPVRITHEEVIHCIFSPWIIAVEIITNLGNILGLTNEKHKYLMYNSSSFYDLNVPNLILKSLINLNCVDKRI